MTTSTRFVRYALGAAVILMAVGTAAAEPPESEENPRGQAVAREHVAPPPPSLPASPSPRVSTESRQAIERNIDRGPGFGRQAYANGGAAAPVRYSESAEADDGQARQRVPPSSGGSRGGSSAGRPSGGGSSPSAGTARPRGGQGTMGPSPRSGGDRGAPATGSGGATRRYPYYGPGGSGGSGYAVRRGTVPSHYPRYDYYHPYRPSYYYPYYGNWGLGFYFWDPSWYGWGGYGYGGYGYGPYSAPYAYGYGASYDETGSIRMRVTPREAQVFVDGYYVGVVDEFDGTFQRLRLEEGPHRIEIRLDGFDTLRFDVRVLLGTTVTLRGALRPLP